MGAMNAIIFIVGECAIAFLIIYLIKKWNEYLKLKKEEYKNSKIDADKEE
jgi:hypothetical protein